MAITKNQRAAIKNVRADIIEQSEALRGFADRGASNAADDANGVIAIPRITLRRIARTLTDSGKNLTALLENEP